jgi:hypothetical protein
MQFFDLEAIFCASRDEVKNAIVLTTPMSSTHLSPEPGVPSLPPLAPTDGDITTSDPVDPMVAAFIRGLSNNAAPTADAFFSPPAAGTGPVDGESYGECGIGASDIESDTLEDVMDDGGSDGEASKSNESSNETAQKPRTEFPAARPELRPP